MIQNAEILHRMPKTEDLLPLLAKQLMVLYQQHIWFQTAHYELS